MNYFYKKIDLRSRKAMIDFLENHYRYNTMNSWNNSTSYANKVKIHSLGLTRDQQNKAYELMEAEEFYDDFNWILNRFGESHDWQWQAAFNGRSCGYVVLYQGNVEWRTIFTFEGRNCERDYADGYGWLSIEEAKKRGLYKKKIGKIRCWPGRSTDQGEDFTDWDMGSLRDRVKIVQEFDRMCDELRDRLIDMIDYATVKEEEYTVTKTRKVIEYA